MSQRGKKDRIVTGEAGSQQSLSNNQYGRCTTLKRWIRARWASEVLMLASSMLFIHEALV